MANITACLSSNSMEWSTPQNLFNKYKELYNLDLDVAASDTNHKCDMYFTKQDDGLSKDWSGHKVWCNPPYGKQIKLWIEKASREARNTNTLICMLIPSRTDTSYFHEYIYKKENVKIEFLRGRIKFLDENGIVQNSAPFPSMIVVFNPTR